MAVENVQEKQEAKHEDANATAREVLTGEALSSKAGAAAGSVVDALSKNSSNVQEHLPGLTLGNSGEKHGIVTTYDADGNATSDCNGPIPRKGERTHIHEQIGGADKTEGKVGEIQKKLEQQGGMDKELGKLGGLDKHEGSFGNLEKKLNNDELQIIHKDGVEKLSTGDYVIKKGDLHGYFSKDGVSDQIVVNADGSYEINGHVAKSTTKDGVTTVEFKDGAVVAFDQGGIKSVTRDGHTVNIKEVDVTAAFPPPMLKPYFENEGLGHINPR